MIIDCEEQDSNWPDIPFAQQDYPHLPSAQSLSTNNADSPLQMPSLAPAIPSMPGGVQDPNAAKLWKAIGEQYRRRPNIQLAQFQALQHARRGDLLDNPFAQQGIYHHPASIQGPTTDSSAVCAPQTCPPLASETPLMPNEEYDLMQAKLRKAIGDQYRSGARGKLPQGLEQTKARPGLNIPPYLPPVRGIGADDASSVLRGPPALAPTIPLMPGGVSDPNQAKLWAAMGAQYRRGPNVTQFPQNLGRIQPSQSCSRCGHNMAPAIAPQPSQPDSPQGNSISHQQALQDQYIAGFKHALESYQQNLTQSEQMQAFINKLDSLPVRDLEGRVAAWREQQSNLEDRVQEFLDLATRPGAQPQATIEYTRAKQELDLNTFLVTNSQEVLNRKYTQVQAQIAQAQAQALAQAQSQALSPKIE